MPVITATGVLSLVASWAPLGRKRRLGNAIPIPNSFPIPIANPNPIPVRRP